MKKALIALLLASAAAVSAEKPKPNPSDYTMDVHVQSSRLVNSCTDVNGGSNLCYWFQSLNVTIGGKKYELFGNSMGKNIYLLRPGDYKAKIVKEDTSRSYGYQRTYQLLLSGEQTADYLVVGESE